MIVGGVGHTINILRDKFQSILLDYDVVNKSEAEMMIFYLK